MEPPHGLVLCCPADVGSVPFLGTALRNSWRAGHEVHLNNINIMISIGAVFLERQPRELPIPRHQRATGGDGSVHRAGNTEQSVCVDLPWQQSCTGAQVVFCRCFCVVLLLSCRPVAGCVGAEPKSQSSCSTSCLCAVLAAHLAGDQCGLSFARPSGCAQKQQLRRGGCLRCS